MAIKSTTYVGIKNQDVGALSVLGMTANKNIAQYPVLNRRLSLIVGWNYRKWTELLCACCQHCL